MKNVRLLFLQLLLNNTDYTGSHVVIVILYYS